MDKLGIIHANQTAMCLESPKQMGRLTTCDKFKLSNNFLTDRSKVVILVFVIAFCDIF